ncbi:MAG: class I SAM-dependent methyltransferase [Ilumatobacteraceae bacterium]
MGRSDDSADALTTFQVLVFTKLEGAITAGMIHLGDRLGLYLAMKGAAAPVTSGELAGITGLAERWVREWAFNQAAAGILHVESDDVPERFSLTPEGAAVLATPEHEAYGMGMFHQLPQTMATLEELPESFRTGLGFDYDVGGPQGAIGVERSFEPWNRNHLLPTVLPALDGVVEKLVAGAEAADLGCGAGGAVLLMAAAFPVSRFTGYDISHHALARAEVRLAESGLTNATFADPRRDPLPTDHSLDVVITLDCIHDMTDPQAVMSSIREAIADDGTWLLVDIKAQETFSENVRTNPMASLMYGISVMSCMSSALSEPGGAGLGTLGLPQAKAEAMTRQAGFTRFRRVAIDHAVNNFYEVRP